jgi:hypothetical protein
MQSSFNIDEYNLNLLDKVGYEKTIPNTNYNDRKSEARTNNTKKFTKK